MMNDPASAAAPEEHIGDWPLRPWLLAGLLGLAGLLIHFAGAGDGPGTKTGWRAALVALCFFGPLAFAFLVERERWKGALGFAFGAGAVMAGLAWRAVGAGDSYADPAFGFMAGVLATAIALPLFQAGFHRTRFATPYRDLHGAAWNDAISGAGALAFVGAAWLSFALLAALFHLLRLDLLQDLMRQDWFGWLWSGTAFGAALGVLRNELRILGTLQRVVMVVLAILAVPMALGLAIFLLAMVVSGPDVLWAATRSATPILLTCAAGAWLLANAILRDSDAEASGNRLLRLAGLVLALSVFPLTVFAAISLGTRVAQHGLSPERLWGLVAIGVACAYGFAWLVAVLRGWRSGGWMARLREANTHLAVAISVVAMFLALPILDFGGISAANQVARLKRGQVSATEFDYAALKWEFGAAGQRALVRLAMDPNADIARLAKVALAQKARPHVSARAIDTAPDRLANARFQFSDAKLRTDAEAMITRETEICGQPCVLLDLGTGGDPAQRVAVVQGDVVFWFGYDDNGALVRDWQVRNPPAAPSTAEPMPDPAKARVEVRPYRGRQIYLDGKPVGTPFE